MTRSDILMNRLRVQEVLEKLSGDEKDKKEITDIVKGYHDILDWLWSDMIDMHEAIKRRADKPNLLTDMLSKIRDLMASRFSESNYFDGR